MKRIILQFLFVSALVLVLSACANKGVSFDKGLILPEVGERTAIIKDCPQSADPEGRPIAAAVGDGAYFCATEISGPIYRIDLYSGKTQALSLSLSSCDALAASNESLFILSNDIGTITELSFLDYSLKSTVDCPKGKKFNCMDIIGDAIAVAGGSSVWTKSGDKEWKETVLKDEKENMSILEISFLEDGRVAYCAEYLYMAWEIDGVEYTDTRTCIGILDPDTGKNSMLGEEMFARTIYADGTSVFVVEGSVVKEYQADECSAVLYLREHLEGNALWELAPGNISSLRVTDRSVLVSSDSRSEVVIYPRETEGQIRILSSEYGLSSFQMENRTLRADEEIFKPVFLTEETMVDKIMMKLMAKDDDYDIAYVRGNTDEIATLLGAMIRDRQYVDLRSNDKMKAVIDEMLPGAQRMLQVNDEEVCCLPVNVAMQIIGLNPLASASGISLPVDWTLDDLIILCDQLETIEGDLSVFPRQQSMRYATLLVQMIQGHLQDRDMSSVESRQIIQSVLALLEPYASDGILAGSGTPVILSVSIGALDETTRIEGAGDFQLLMPPVISTGDQTPVNVSGFIFVNPYSPNKDRALEYLASLYSDEMKYQVTGTGEVPFWAGIENYYYWVIFGDRTNVNGPLSVVTEESKTYYNNLDDILDGALARTSLCTLPSSYEANKAMDDFLHGKLTADQAADLIYRELVYLQQG